MKKYVLHFHEIHKTHLPKVGGKGANLGEMAGAGFPVPPGFCVTTEAYRALIQSSPEMDEWFNRLERVHGDDLEGIRKLGKQIRNHIRSLAVPGDVQREIVEAWKTYGPDKAYAVRSSATAEDLPTASFAGQQETSLNVRGQEALLEAVRDCWASLFTDRAISYRAKNGFDHRSVHLSVVVQEMVLPEVSGIMFTADPVTGNRNIVSIDAGFGLGEALVSGLVSADLYQVRFGKIINKRISQKRFAIVPLPQGGTITQELPPEKQKVQSLRDKHILELAGLGKKIEAHYGSPQDIEWCLAEGKFYIVQSRPITTLYPVPPTTKEGLRVFISFGHPQMMTDAMKPMGLSVFRTVFPFGKSAPDEESPYMLPAGGRLYVDLTEILSLKIGRKVFPRVFMNVDEQIGGALREFVKRNEFAMKPNPYVRKKVVRFVLPILFRLLSNILCRNPTRAMGKVNAFMKQSVQQCRDIVAMPPGPERIRRIQRHLGTLFLSLLRHMFPYPLTGVATFHLIRKCSQKWLGEEGVIQLLNKSLPGNVTSEMGLMIGDLADTARNFPELVKVLEKVEDEPFYEELLQVPGGETFLQEWERFMAKYGMRCPGEIDITAPRWSESPRMLIPSILSHIRSVIPGEHRARFKQGEKEAEEAANALLSRVRKTPFGYFKALFLARLIRVFRHYMALREHPKYIIVQHLFLIKQALLEEGRILVGKNVLKNEQDVFFLTLDELLSVAENRYADSVLELVESRKREFLLDQKRTPPRVMTSEGEIIPGKRHDKGVPEGALSGTPVSSGVVEGIARVVLRPELARLNPGEILIAPFTDPGWTPLFQSAKGLVMEVGGLMTHGAVVAREYGIPAVVGIDRATEIIKDGAYIRVDGTKGYVQILSDPKGNEKPPC